MGKAGFPYFPQHCCMTSADTNRLRLLRTELVRHREFPRLDVDLVGGIAGDRPLTAEESQTVEDLRKRRGKAFHADLIFALTHHHYPYEVSELLWQQILRHKGLLNEKLRRNVGIAVATLDFLQNVEKCLDSPALISQQRISDISELALKDALTGLFDHMSFEMWLNHEVRCYSRYRTPVSLILIDLDNFKRVNDQHGHQEGDRALILVSHLMQTLTRGVDMVARYGGEEFAVILSRAGTDEAAIVAERLRRDITKESGDLRITASLGVATCPDDAINAADLLGCADEAIYQSKQHGKNRVTLHRSLAQRKRP